jgi:geranylgeranylglycerol-phosphate geranylgeranyltransferase
MKKNKFSGAVQISRPINVFISFISIFIAAFITGTVQPIINVMLACFSGGIIMAAANTINDYYDIEIDKINKPERPLAQGFITPSFAYKLAFIEFAIGIFLSAFINKAAFLVALSVSAMLVLYSYRLKRMPIIGNFTVSFSTAMAFIYGGISVNRINLTVVPAILAFFYHFGREVIKDIQDMTGDAGSHARTFPLVHGKRKALKLIIINYVLLLLVLPVPYLFNWYNIKYLITVLIGVYPVLIYSMISIWRDPVPDNLGNISNILKADMLMGLLALYLGI